MKKIILVYLILLTGAAAQNPDQQLKALQNKFESIDDLTVNIVQKSGGKEVFSGKLSYKKENKFILDLKNNLIVSDGNSIWNYNKKENKVIISSIDESDPSFFSFRTFVYDYPSRSNLISDDNVLVFTPKKNAGLNFNKARIWITDNNLLDKIQLEGSPAGEVEITFYNYRLNQDLEDSKFSFTSPEGSTVIDLR